MTPKQNSVRLLVSSLKKYDELGAALGTMSTFSFLLGVAGLSAWGGNKFSWLLVAAFLCLTVFYWLYSAMVFVALTAELEASAGFILLAGEFIVIALLFLGLIYSIVWMTIGSLK